MHSNAELPARQLLNPYHFSQILQVEASERRYYMQTNPWPVRIFIRDEVKSAAAEIPHAANFLEITISRIGKLDVNEPIDLDTWLTTPVWPIWGSLFFSQGKHPLF